MSADNHQLLRNYDGSNDEGLLVQDQLEWLATGSGKNKLSVLVLDEQPEAGGQIFCSISTTERLRPGNLTARE